MKKAYPALPSHLNELMQTANMEYINGREEQAIEILREVIRERADAHHAWLSLAMIYNSKKNIVKMVQCQMMAAHLSASNDGLWKGLGNTSRELGQEEQAMYCFRKVLV